MKSAKKASIKPHVRTRRPRENSPSPRESSRLHSVIDSAVDAIITIDERGTIETVNPAVQNLFGYTQGELIGKNVNVLMPEPYHGEHHKYVQNYLHTGKAKIIGIGREVVARRKDGSTFPIDLAVSEFRHRNRRMFTGIIRDISARKQMEAMLQEREGRMRSIVETAVDGIFTINEKGIIHTLNRAALEIFGYTEEELIGKNIKMLMPEPFHSEHDGYLQDYVQTGNARIIGIGREVVARRKDGSTFPIDLAVSEFHDGRQRMFTGIVRNISARKQSEYRLRVEHEVTSILAHSPSLKSAISQILRALCKNLECNLGEFFVLDTAKVELRCIEFFASSPGAIQENPSFSLGKTFSIKTGIPGKVWESKSPIWLDDVVKNEAFERTEDARKLGIRTSIGIPILSKGDLVGVMTLFSTEKREQDEELLNMMTAIGIQIGQFIERNRVEGRLKAFEEKIRHGEKLMVLGMLASEIAHEIGTPLNIISGRVELIAEREKSNEQLRKELSIINQQLERINTIVREHLNLLRASRIERSIELNGLLNTLVAFFQPYAEKANVKLELSLTTVPAIRGNEDQLQQVFINLMMNAIQEMQKGGKLSILSKQISREGTNFAEVSIHDTGKGIPEEALGKIFEPFFSTKSQAGGTGLGLAIVRDIVERHQGEIVVETEVQKGTTFYVRIPAENN